MSHDLVELLVVVNAVLVGADTFAEIEWWAQEKLEPELKPFVVLESERQIKGRTSIERRLYLEQPARRCTAVAARHPRPLRPCRT
ncbi:hypothetical protein AGMMS49960_07960 [Betaproteobacteria bacterium]|nr:hypothetical protein AGMMS49543_28460 [Betaproteobacteria bacterium]GHU00299.1 hypothetical protein AGMMS49960_07960 [Betaproteobacteria bacterium]GHU23286.1 hypothetical protein AGMMS50243_24420 [Betaproteobacteria bacterium]